MFPSLFVGCGRDDLSPVFTAGIPIVIGNTRQLSNAASILLKECAPLAKGGWAIFAYLETTPSMTYGLFRSSRHSLSTAADEVIADLGQSVQLMHIRNCGHQAVALHNTSDQVLTAVFKIAPNQHLDTVTQLSSLVAAATRTVEEGAEFQAYFHRLLSGIIQHCHGTLIGVIPTFLNVVPLTVTSGVRPIPKIDLAALHASAVRLRDADSLADLRAAEVLLEGMVGSDGIVVFGCDGSIQAFRPFIKASPEEGNHLGVEGGARRRAFELMKLRLGTDYLAVFYRSQDGDTKCEVRV